MQLIFGSAWFRQQSRENEIFEQCHSAEKYKRGTLWDFLTSIANYRKNWRGTLWCNPKNFKKSRIVPKKSGANVGSLVCFRGSGRVLFFLFALDALLRFRLLWTSVVQVVEQMNKKVDLARLKQLPTVRVGHFSSKAPTKKTTKVKGVSVTRPLGTMFVYLQFVATLQIQGHVTSAVTSP